MHAPSTTANVWTPTARRHAARRPRRTAAAAAALLATALLAAPASAQTDGLPGDDAPESDWIALFNGRDLDGFVAKIRRHPVGENFAGTFRVEDGLLTVSYDGYETFSEQFGHLFYETPFSHYRLRIEYRFIGDSAPDTPAWAIRNSGVMIHAQPPATMRRDQDFPVSVEVQFLGGLGNGEPRPTANVCSPGTHVVYDGALTETHCIESGAPTFDGDVWVSTETLVLGGERIVHFVDGRPVLEYGGIVTGGGVVSGHDPAELIEGAPRGSGYLALQSEGHPIQFRRVELLDLSGCMDPDAEDYKPYAVASAPERCSPTSR